MATKSKSYSSSSKTTSVAAFNPFANQNHSQPSQPSLASQYASYGAGKIAPKVSSSPYGGQFGTGFGSSGPFQNNNRSSSPAPVLSNNVYRGPIMPTAGMTGPTLPHGPSAAPQTMARPVLKDWSQSPWNAARKPSTRPDLTPGVPYDERTGLPLAGSGKPMMIDPFEGQIFNKNGVIRGQNLANPGDQMDYLMRQPPDQNGMPRVFKPTLTLDPRMPQIQQLSGAGKGAARIDVNRDPWTQIEPTPNGPVHVLPLPHLGAIPDGRYTPASPFQNISFRGASPQRTVINPASLPHGPSAPSSLQGARQQADASANAYQALSQRFPGLQQRMSGPAPQSSWIDHIPFLGSDSSGDMRSAYRGLKSALGLSAPLRSAAGTYFPPAPTYSPTVAGRPEGPALPQRPRTTSIAIADANGTPHPYFGQRQALAAAKQRINVPPTQSEIDSGGLMTSGYGPVTRPALADFNPTDTSGGFGARSYPANGFAQAMGPQRPSVPQRPMVAALNPADSIGGFGNRPETQTEFLRQAYPPTLNFPMVAGRPEGPALPQRGRTTVAGMPTMPPSPNNVGASPARYPAVAGRLNPSSMADAALAGTPVEPRYPMTMQQLPHLTRQPQLASNSDTLTAQDRGIIAPPESGSVYQQPVATPRPPSLPPTEMVAVPERMPPASVYEAPTTVASTAINPFASNENRSHPQEQQLASAGGLGGLGGERGEGGAATKPGSVFDTYKPSFRPWGADFGLNPGLDPEWLRRLYQYQLGNMRGSAA